MKIKVGKKIYDGETEPVMVILSDNDKNNIANMLPECKRYCSYPDGWFGTDEDAYSWMEDETNHPDGYEGLLVQSNLIFCLSDKGLLPEEQTKEFLENLLPYLKKEDRMDIMESCVSRQLFTIVDDKWRHDE